MPVIVIGADTPAGEAILATLRGRAGEVRAFVSDENVGDKLRRSEVKVATGDVSDLSHVEAACMNCFCAVLVTGAADDGRELAFGSAAATVDGWRSAVRSAGITRAIWVTDSPAVLPDVANSAPEVQIVNSVGRDVAALASEVADLEEAAQI
ncbi:MAG: NAD(P)H-binding protein [Acidimicrobiia bacterium]|nr:NAD(P)H-binding protein [Acidimicrobiia bacterium]